MRPKKKKKHCPAQPAIKTAYWEPCADGPVTKARCSGCDFTVEPIRAVETGWSSAEFTDAKYKFCPMCGSKMSVHGKDSDA
ncbi:MAG: hypothetical protein NC311_14805 [Muribaculaceae bacterium]|nr:hypothetical protein [Muribaculaceae bacterium]